MTAIFDGTISAMRTSRVQPSLVLRVGEESGTSRLSSRRVVTWHEWIVGARPLPPDYAHYLIVRLAATNPVRNLRDGPDTSVVEDDAENVWTRASAETCSFERGPTQYRETHYAIVEGALRPGDRITVKLPNGLSFDRAAAEATLYYAPFAPGFAGADLYLSRQAAGTMWWAGFETLLAHGIDAAASGQQLKLKIAIAAEGEATGDALARMAPNAKRNDDVEAIVSGLMLLNNARRQRPSVREQRRVPLQRPAVKLTLVK